jgi:hypothetical protein
MMLKKIKKGGKAQISVFIILAVCLYIVLLLLLTKKSDIVSLFIKESPVDKIERCISEAANDGRIILELQGGSFNPKNNYTYDGSQIEYACYTNQYYKRCVMQKPLLKQSFENELKGYIELKVSDCLAVEKSSLEGNGYVVSMKNPIVQVDIIPRNIIINTDLDLQITKGEATDSYRNIKANVNSDLYEFLMIASSILNWEARYGDSETMNYMYYYPSIKVEKKTRSDGSRIYILTNRESSEKLMFATRSMVFPPGITGE